MFVGRLRGLGRFVLYGCVVCHVVFRSSAMTNDPEELQFNAIQYMLLVAGCPPSPPGSNGVQQAGVANGNAGLRSPGDGTQEAGVASLLLSGLHVQNTNQDI